MQITYNYENTEKNGVDSKANDNMYGGIITKEYNPVVLKTTREIFAPVMCDFIGWVLLCAKAAGLKRLYFLARDGWIMYNLAKVIARKNSLDIELKYLYCSRLSLRNAALGDLGEEAYGYLLEGGFTLTPKIILSRLQLNNDERNKVYIDIGFNDDENTEMGKSAAAEFRARLKKSLIYNEFIKSVSKDCKSNAVGYLKQEGLLDEVAYGIADSGWTGSIQKILTVLTGKKQMGYYFGLYARPDKNYGEYNAYLFDKSTSPLLVSRFNNNLFETLCSAPHGMTISYKKENGTFIPVLKEDNSFNPFQLNENILITQQNEIMRYAEQEYVIQSDISGIKARQRSIFPLLDKLMYRPDIEAAQTYGGLRFSDDPSELYSFPLASKIEDVKRMYLIPRLAEKFLHKGNIKQPIYWSYGTAPLSGKGRFCRANLRLWEILWLMKR